MVSFIDSLVGLSFRARGLRGALAPALPGQRLPDRRLQAFQATPPTARGRGAAVAGQRPGRRRTCVIFLTMHRSGSSATVRLLQAAGLELGSAPLVGPHPSNPYGHFESLPCVDLNRRLQQRLFGFADELPPQRERLFPFVQSAPLIADPAGYAEPADFRAGRRIAAMLGQDGVVSGLKDPRMPLLWGFWQRIISGMQGAEIVPVLVLRSPHAIASSITARSGGLHRYGDALLATERHLRCLAAIAGTLRAVHVVRFGTEFYAADVRRVADRVGLTLTADDVDANLDRSCMHFADQAIDHPAQAIYADLCGRFAA